MSKLSQPMIDALVSSTEDEFGFQLGEIKRQTYTALEGRGLSSGGWLTPAGIEARSEHVSTPETVVPQDEPLADWERELLGETEVVAPAVITHPTPSEQGGEPDYAYENSIRGRDALAEDLLKAVDLDKPHVVPNREEKRKGNRVMRAVCRLFAKKRDQRTKKWNHK